MKIKLFTLALMLSSAMAQAQSTQVIDLSTGVVNGVPAALTSADNTWTVKIPGTTTFGNAYVTNNRLVDMYGVPAAWTYPTTDTLGNGCGNSYISPYVVFTPGTAFGCVNCIWSPNFPFNLTPLGTYQYKMQFTKYNCTATSANITFSAGVDNHLDSISINGHSHDLSSYIIDYFSGLVGPINFSIPVTELVSGPNTIIAYASNYSGPTCFYMCGNLTINYANDADLVPSFTGPSAFCDGVPLSFTWSDGPSTSTNYYWELAECNSSGVLITPGFTWSGWYPGTTPGTYTFPSNIGVTCGKYYRVKLAVQNQCVSWRETTKVIRVNCLPTANAGSDATICNGSCVTIGTGGSLGHGIAYQWTGPTGILGTYSSVNVCPSYSSTAASTATTYTYTVTNSSTGCSASDNVTVTVINNDPVFSLLVDPANPSYFTVQATAINTNAFSTPGFYYSLEVQELNGSGTPYYTDAGTDAWWYFPANDFKGFVSTGTGTFTQTPWWTSPTPAAGRFLYGHTYKIKRTTWNDNCPQQSYYVIITPVRNMATGNTTMEVTEQGIEAVDLNSLDMTAISEQAKANNISIYPNPSNGIFSLETGSNSKASIEIYDALGKKVKAFEHSGFKSTIDLSGQPKGMYMLNILTDGKLTSKKIILE